MKVKNVLLPLIIISASMFACRYGHATTVYQWTDTEGVVHFSDVAPAQNGATETRKINLSDFNKTTPARHTYSIIEQANIMAKWRKQAEAQWLARKRLDLEQQRLTEEIEANRQKNKDSSRDELQSLPYYYMFPRAVNYRYQERRYDRPRFRNSSGFRQWKRPDVTRRHNRTPASGATHILKPPLF